MDGRRVSVAWSSARPSCQSLPSLFSTKLSEYATLLSFFVEFLSFAEFLFLETRKTLKFPDVLLLSPIIRKLGRHITLPSFQLIELGEAQELGEIPDSRTGQSCIF